MSDHSLWDDGSDAAGGPLRFLESSRPTGEDLEFALRAAERLLVRAEERRRHEHNRYFAIVSVLIGTVLSLIAAIVSVVEVITFRNTVTQVFAGTISVTAATVIVLWSSWTLRKYQIEAKSDTTLSLATQISSLVGDVLLDVAEREAWSALHLEAMKLRLSAFPLSGRPRRFGGW